MLNNLSLSYIHEYETQLPSMHAHLLFKIIKINSVIYLISIGMTARSNAAGIFKIYLCCINYCNFSFKQNAHANVYPLFIGCIYDYTGTTLFSLSCSTVLNYQSHTQYKLFIFSIWKYQITRSLWFILLLGAHLTNTLTEP